MKLCVITPALVSIAFALGCSASNGKDNAPSGGDFDAGVDTGHGSADTGPLGECTPGFTNAQPCGSCGKQTHTCGSDAKWGAWSACTGEAKGAECMPGQTH